MRFRLDVLCDTPAFMGEPPHDLLGEVSRILEEVLRAAKQKELFVPSEATQFKPRSIHDIDGSYVGEVWFEV